MIYAFFTEIKDPWPAAFFAEKMALLPERFQNKINMYVQWKDRHLRLASKLLLIELLKCYFPEKEISIKDAVYNIHHQLILPDPFFMSASHSGNIATCVLSMQAPIGIDVEKKGILKAEVSQYFFSKTEQLTPDRFYEFWTRKEAVLKAAGLGLDLIDLANICAATQKVNFNNSIYETASLDLHSEYAAQIASPCLKLEPININQILFTHTIDPTRF